MWRCHRGWEREREKERERGREREGGREGEGGGERDRERGGGGSFKIVIHVASTHNSIALLKLTSSQPVGAVCFPR